MGHRQEVLCGERRGIGRVRRGSDAVRNGAVVAPIFPHVLNACTTALRRSCCNCVARTRSPGKRLS